MKVYVVVEEYQGEVNCLEVYASLKSAKETAAAWLKYDRDNYVYVRVEEVLS